MKERIKMTRFDMLESVATLHVLFIIKTKLFLHEHFLRIFKNKLLSAHCFQCTNICINLKFNSCEHAQLYMDVYFGILLEI